MDFKRPLRICGPIIEPKKVVRVGSLVVEAERVVSAGGVLLLVLRRRLPRVRMHDLAVRFPHRETDGAVASCVNRYNAIRCYVSPQKIEYFVDKKLRQVQTESPTDLLGLAARRRAWRLRAHTGSSSPPCQRLRAP